SPQRQHLAFAQQEDVATDWSSESYLLIVGDGERAVVLRQTFIEPERDVCKSVFDEQVSVLVKDDRERVLLAAHFSRERDVVDVRSRLKVSGGIRVRLERRIRRIALEHDNSRRHGTVESHVRKQSRKHLAKLLEFQANF